jgi:hypothetical protein
MDVVHVQTHSCEHCQKIIFDLRHQFEEVEKAVLDLQDQIEDETFSQPKTAEENHVNMAAKGVLFDVTYPELCAGAAAGCRLFCWIVDDEWISQETIHSIARRDMPIDDPSSIIGWAFRDSSLWFAEWLPEPDPEHTLAKILPSPEHSLERCRLWASTYQKTGNPLDIEYIQFFGLWDPVSQKIVYRTRHGLEAFAQPEDPSSQTISNRPISKYPASSL